MLQCKQEEMRFVPQQLAWHGDDISRGINNSDKVLTQHLSVRTCGGSQVVLWPLKLVKS